jgi:hypothetical protein
VARLPAGKERVDRPSQRRGIHATAIISDGNDQAACCVILFDNQLDSRRASLDSILQDVQDMQSQLAHGYFSPISPPTEHCGGQKRGWQLVRLCIYGE